jgi:dTDP-4-amino-4,6-dideoxygalactose transaminase
MLQDSRQVPLLDLKAQHSAIAAEIHAAVSEVIESQRFVLGPVVEECERRIAAYCGARHGVGMSSGTDALLAALMAEGIGRGDEVITTSYSFFATAGSVVRLGATPIFVDIEPDTFLMDVGQIEALITERTRAIVPVHLYGQMVCMDSISWIANKHNLVVIEDAAQAIGAKRNGRQAGAEGQYGCLSFFPSKNLGCAGDGGMVLTQDPHRAQKLAIVRGHGAEERYFHRMVGGNFRLDAIQAAVLNVKIRNLDTWTALRQKNADRYRNLFTALGLDESEIILPAEASDRNGQKSLRHIYNQFVIRVPGNRDQLKQYLLEQGIGTEIYYPLPLHLQECFGYLGYTRGELPESERAALETLALPIYPELTDDQASFVADSIAKFLRGKAALRRAG